ncbi:hypothetical protein [Sphingomonas phyllosphaerae]
MLLTRGMTVRAQLRRLCARAGGMAFISIKSALAESYKADDVGE